MASWYKPPGYNSDWGPVLYYASGLLGCYIPVRSAMSPLRDAALWQGQQARPPPRTLSTPLPCLQGLRSLRTRPWSSLAQAVYYMLVFRFGAARTLFCTAALPQNSLVRAAWVVQGRFGGGGACVRDVVVLRAPLPPFGPGFLNPSSRRSAPHVRQCCRGWALREEFRAPRSFWQVCFWVRVVLPSPPPVSASQGWTARLVCLSGVRTGGE